MIPISNAWGMTGNSISYSKVVEIANEARAAVNAQNADTEALSYSPNMKVGERIFDYVFCGCVKHEFMQHLYKMAHERARLEFVTKDDFTNQVMSNDQRKRCYLSRMRIKEQGIERMLSGNSLTFGSDPFQQHSNRETFLIYRSNARRTSVGMALQLQKSLAQAPSQTLPAAQVPKFENAGHIRRHNLEAIKKLGCLRSGQKIYDVRFTDNDEPVVMQLEADHEADLIQKRLLNLWAIDNVQKRLTDLGTRPCKKPVMSYSSNSLDSRNSLLRRDPGFTHWNRHISEVQKKLADAVSAFEQDLKARSRALELELDLFAQVINPTWNDKSAFLQFQKKIAALEERRTAANQIIRHCHKKLTLLSELIQQDGRPVINDALKRRMLNFTDKFQKFILSDMTSAETEKFKRLCDVQSDWRAHFLPDRLSTLLTPEKIESWSHTLHPPSLEEDQNKLLHILEDPATVWTGFLIAMHRLKIEQDARIALRIRQSEVGNEFANTLHFWRTGRIPDPDQRSPEINRLLGLLKQQRDYLLTPGNCFTSSELDTLKAQRDSIRNDLWDEYGRLNRTLETNNQ